jgi:hypothetical protein
MTRATRTTAALSFALLATLSHRARAESPTLTITPVLLQHANLFLSDRVTAGGIGGGLGVQLGYHTHYVMQADVSALWGFGNIVSTRAAFGAQWHGVWSPAAWLTFGALFGDRLEFLTNDGTRPAIPSWAIGLRASPLRYVSEDGHVSLLEPGLATDLSGGMWIELSVLQVGATF